MCKRSVYVETTGVRPPPKCISHLSSCLGCAYSPPSQTNSGKEKWGKKRLTLKLPYNVFFAGEAVTISQLKEKKYYIPSQNAPVSLKL